jgi:benzylsuccinate CoA-transferase BbsE subunit
MKGLNVIEIGESPAGELVGRILAEHGAHVTKLEPPAGAGSRRRGPFTEQAGAPESLHFRYYNLGKNSQILDLHAPDAKAALDAMLASADVLVSSLSTAELSACDLDLSQLSERHPALIIVSVTPFGLTGPWRNYQANDLVSIAAGGPLILSGYDDHSLPPICPAGGQSFHTGASFAISGVLVALLDRTHSGLGQLVDVAIHDSLAVTIELAFPYWEYSKQALLRQTCRHAQPRFTQPAIFECADGRFVYFALIIVEEKPWEALVAWMEAEGVAADLTSEAYRDAQYRQDNFPHIQAILECFLRLKTSDALLREGQARQLPVGIVYAPEDLLQDEHLREREFFLQVQEADGSRNTYPGRPYRYSTFDLVPARRAPRLGERLDAS